MGSKTTLRSIANDLTVGNIETVLVCLDSDYDHLLGRAIDCPLVVYTHGYSWENDVVGTCSIEAVFRLLLPADERTDQLLLNLNRKIAVTKRQLLRWCEVDIALIGRGKGGLFVRSGPLALFDNVRTQPQINMGRLRSRLAVLGYKRSPPRRVLCSDGDSLRHGCGKMVAQLIYGVTVGLAKSRDSKLQVPLDMFLRLCIAETFRTMSDGRQAALAAHFGKWRTVFE